MKLKKITIIILVLIIPILTLPKAYKLVTYRKQAIEYLEDKYSENFDLSLFYKISKAELGDVYAWKVTSKTDTDKSFTVTREQSIINNDIHYYDSYSTDKLKNDILEYYNNTVTSYFDNVIVKFSPTTSTEKVYDTYTDFLENEPSSICIYINYDNNFNYDVEAEKILNLIQNENTYNHKIYLEIYYINDETYNNLYDGKISYVSKGSSCKKYYSYSLTNDEKSINNLTKELIIEDLKKVY